jgi:protein tyrosine/serine phosphatase
VNNFQNWFSEKVTISKYPTADDIQAGRYDNFQYRLNVSDIFRPEVDVLFKHAGVDCFWFPLGEAFGMGLESLYGALRIMWEAEKQDQSLLLHCHAGRNRSVMVADSYYFLRTQEHRLPDQLGLKYALKNQNRLLLNIDDGQFQTGVYKMEEFLQGCLESFDDAFTEGDRPLAWIKHQMPMTGSGFAV